MSGLRTNAGGMPKTEDDDLADAWAYILSFAEKSCGDGPGGGG